MLEGSGGGERSRRESDSRVTRHQASVACLMNTWSCVAMCMTSSWPHALYRAILVKIITCPGARAVRHGCRVITIVYIKASPPFSGHRPMQYLGAWLAWERFAVQYLGAKLAWEWDCDPERCRRWWGRCGGGGGGEGRWVVVDVFL